MPMVCRYLIIFVCRLKQEQGCECIYQGEVDVGTSLGISRSHVSGR
jgi:hypothetical protein